MLPTVIKSLTNCTELITLNNKLGHGVSKSILEELFTENAFNIIDKQTNKDVCKKTPKSLMLPTVIKSLTNCTELITLNNKLGHGVSNSILEELFTENAFNIINKQTNKDVYYNNCT